MRRRKRNNQQTSVYPFEVEYLHPTLCVPMVMPVMGWVDYHKHCGHLGLKIVRPLDGR